MGGVDNCDRIVRENSCRRSYIHWPLVEFFNLIDISVLDAHNLMKDKYPCRLDFTIKLVQQFCHYFNLQRAKQSVPLARSLSLYGVISADEFDQIYK